jgi:dipeptide/tripeptide permease
MLVTTGFGLAICAGIGYTIIQWKIYKLSPCGNTATSPTCVDADGQSIVAPISVWWMAIPYALGGISELFVNVPAFGIAYSRAPKNMRGLVSALNLFSQALTYIVGLATASIVQDPYLTWDFGGPAIIGFAGTLVFYWLYRDIDDEEYRLSRNETVVDDQHLIESAGDSEKKSSIDEGHVPEQVQADPYSKEIS